MNILVTGFTRFAKHKTNPSELLLKQIHRDGVKTLLLPVEYEGAKKALLKAIEEYKPEAIVLLALSPFCHRPTVEQYAYNELNSIQPDEAGVTMANEVVEANGPSSIMPSLDLTSIQQYILSQGGKCDISVDPGRFVANEVYYEALRKNGNSVLMHLPTEDDYPLEDCLEAVELVLDYIDY